MAIRTIFFSSVFFVIIAPTLFAQSDSLGIDSFNLLNEEEKQAFVLAVLQDRDAQLQNFSYEMAHRLERFTPKDGKTDFFEEASMSLKRLGDKLRLDAKRLDSKERLQEYQACWDGTKAKTLLHRPYLKKMHSGMIKDQEDQNFTYRAYNHILGLRLLDTPKLTLGEWFNEVVTKDSYSVDIDVVEQEGKSLLMFKATVGYKYWQWFLDPNRDYMPVRAEIRYEVNETFNSDSSTVEEAIEVDGLWVPKKVLRITGTSVSDGQGVNTYEISSFTRNTVNEEDFIIEFPPGTEVVDTIANIAYRILPDGGIETLPLYNSATGEITESIDEIVDDVIAQDAGEEIVVNKSPKEIITPEKALDFVEPEPEASTPVSSEKTPTKNDWSWPSILILIIGILFVYGGIKLFIRRSKVDKT